MSYWQLSKWDERFIGLARHIAQWSKDPSNRVGAVLTRDNRIVSLGYNGFPRGTKDDPKIYSDRARKHRRVLHAERNALSFARGNTEGCVIYSSLAPCAPCTAQIIQDGVTRIVAPSPFDNEDYLSRYYEDIEESQEMCTEAGVVLVYF
jgi:dCMP deaminase